jgi:hypothetical protein
MLRVGVGVGVSAGRVAGGAEQAFNATKIKVVSRYMRRMEVNYVLLPLTCHEYGIDAPLQPCYDEFRLKLFFAIRSY